MRLPWTAVIAAFALTLASNAHAAVTLDRQFGYDGSRLKVAERSGLTAVDFKGGHRETRAGWPDLPWISERVELPVGMKVTAVEVTELKTRVVARGARVASAIVPRPGLGPLERSEPDARYFASASPQPEQVAELGIQGNQRGQRVAWLRVSPTQWNPATGELSVVTDLSVRLTLEPDAEPGLERLRIVPQWEDGGPGAWSEAKAAGATVTSAHADRRPRAEPFAAEQLPSLLGSPVAYLIVTNDAMAPVFQQLADWKTQTGVPAVVRTVSFIQQQFPSAADDAERVRLFVRDAYTRWGTKWVLLGGDTHVIPTRLGMTTFYGGEAIATDMYFSCLDGNWDADGDSLFGEGFINASNPGDDCDLLPEVYVGRATVATAADAQVFVDKTLQYERTPLANYEENWLFAAEVLFPQPWDPGDPVSLDGGTLAERLLPLSDQVPELHVVRLYENHTAPTWRPGVLLESRQTVMDSLQQGPSLVLHVGHGYRNIMEVGDASLTNVDAMALTNGDRLFNLYAINCNSAAIDFPCIGEAFLSNPNGGAVTNVGSTRFDFPSTGEDYQYEYFRMLVEDQIDAVGELQAKQKLPFVSNANYDGVHRWTQMTLILMGDPELHMWLGRPSPLTVAAPSSVALSDSQFTVHVDSGGSPLEGALVTAYKAGDDYASVLTDAAGDAVVPFRPDSTGSFTLTVTAYNAHPWQGSVTITPAAGPALSEGVLTVLDDNADGRAGDSNGLVDAAEIVDLIVPVKNLGGAPAADVSASIATPDTLVTLLQPTASYGAVATGATVAPAAGFRVSFPHLTPDQREVPFTMTITDGGGNVFREEFQVTVHSPELRSYSHGETETVGNGDGRPQVGETVNYTVRLRNRGTGTARGVSLVARNTDGMVTITDSTSTIGDIAPGVETSGDAITFDVNALSAKIDLVFSDMHGEIGTQRLDLTTPIPPARVIGVGAATSITLSWTRLATLDLFGFNIYRSTAPGGPFTRVNPYPTDREATYTDEDLLPLTRYYYQVSSVDSSGNESALSAVVNLSTNPPSHTVFPVPMPRNTPAPVAIEYMYSATQMDIAAGSDFIYVLHADGTPPVDADGVGTTLGDFTTRGSYYASGPSVATLDPAQGRSVVGASWDSAAVYVFDLQGEVRPGWPVYIGDPGTWSGVACGDLDGDGTMELCFGSNSTRFYVMRSNGQEWMDGDANPATKGVFKVLGGDYNYGSPSLADLDGDGHPEIIYGGRDGLLNVWKADGSNLPGFPFNAHGNISCSPAIAYLDGPGDPEPEIIFAAESESLFVLEPNGTRRPGWPLWVRAAGTSKIPSPAIADLNNDGFLDIVFQAVNGFIFTYNRNAVGIAPLHFQRYSTKTSGASESSPVVADLDGDGRNDVLCGDENGSLTALSGMTGAVMAGFPIQLSGEVRGTPAVADIDGDGRTEIVLAGWDKNLYVWDYDFTFQPNGQVPWPQFLHDARRTGFYDSPLFVGVDDTPGGVTPLASLEFAPPAPNPASGGTRMWFGIPADLSGQTYELSIYDLTGRRVRTVDTGTTKAGRFSLTWDLRDQSRRPVAGGVYFARFAVAGKFATQKLVVLP